MMQYTYNICVYLIFAIFFLIAYISGCFDNLLLRNDKKYTVSF